MAIRQKRSPRSLATGAPADAEAVFRTSGTTHGPEKRGVHYVMDVSLYHLSLIDMETAIRHALAHYRGVSSDELAGRTQAWFNSQVASCLRPKARQAFEDHRRQGHALIILTNSSCYEARAATEAWQFDGYLANQFDLDERGCLRIVGRKKDLIIRGGHNIHPARIEDLAHRHPAVQKAMVRVAPLLSRLGERPGFERLPRYGVGEGDVPYLLARRAFGHGALLAEEGCEGIGRHVAQRLIAEGESVVDVQVHR